MDYPEIVIRNWFKGQISIQNERKLMSFSVKLKMMMIVILKTLYELMIMKE